MSSKTLKTQRKTAKKRAVGTLFELKMLQFG